jgi:tetratricopeptide (TPR) repeat protein
MKMMLIILLFNISLFANEAENKFNKANEYYNSGEYEQAIELYKSIIDNGYNDSKIYYNIGNAYYKTEQIPESILYYEKALKANPDNEDAQFNLRLANLKTIDKIEELPKVFYAKWYDNLLKMTTSNGLALFSTIILWLAFLLFIMFILIRSSFLKKISFALGVLTLVLFIVVSIFAWNSYQTEQHKKEAIIFSSSIYIKSSPDDAGTNLFMLHEGTKVEILDSVNDWYKIKIKDGNIGWLAPGSVEVI